jgi:hypothetical protein
MRLMSDLTRGKYSNDFDNVHPDILERYLGVHGPPSQRQHSGAGASDDDEDYSDLDDRIAIDQEHHIRHDPIEVPPHSNPFKSPDTEALFDSAHRDVVAAGIVPSGFGVQESEWDGEIYPEHEDIKSGRGGKHLNICLPFVIWWPRAVAWAQALELMTKICMAENGE